VAYGQATQKGYIYRRYNFEENDIVPIYLNLLQLSVQYRPICDSCNLHFTWYYNPDLSWCTISKQQRIMGKVSPRTNSFNNHTYRMFQYLRYVWFILCTWRNNSND